MQRSSDIEAATAELGKRLESGSANPLTDARAAADRGDFGLIYSASGLGGGARTPGVICHTPYMQGPSTKAGAQWGDNFTPEVTAAMNRFVGYASAYNRAVIDHPKFPYADLCAPATESDQRTGGVGGLDLIGRRARALTRAPLGLHEAARRGSVAQVRDLLARYGVDELDDFNMTPLAWAVAHGRVAVAEVLIHVGAKSMPEGLDNRDVTPVLAAISQKRLGLLRRLDAPRPYPAQYVETAIRSNDPAMVRAVFDAPHESPRQTELLGSTTPSAPVAKVIIEREGKAAANAVLLEGASKGRVDLVHLAIGSGADVNATGFNGQSPLLAALDTFAVDPRPVLDLLLAAGADVNQKPRPGLGYETPFWKAYFLATSSVAGREDLLPRVLRAGGDASVPRRPGVPSVWTVVFPPRGDLTEITAPSPEVLEALVHAGMDLNAPYQGQCVLNAVERLTGPSGQVATTLRRLGAKRAAGGICA
jgi:ankyrin repeat protein